MRNKLANISALLRFRVGYEQLVSQSARVPERMMILSGPSGSAKTTTVATTAANVGACYVAASPNWTPSSMLRDICLELGVAPLHRTKAMEDCITERLGSGRKALFVDEVDFFWKRGSSALKDSGWQMLETLRTIHDRACTPVILIGTEGLGQRISHLEQLDRRIAQRVHFGACTMEDAATLADTCCEIKIQDDLLEKIYAETQGSVGRLVVKMSELEGFARAQCWKSMSSVHYHQMVDHLNKKRGGR